MQEGARKEYLKGTRRHGAYRFPTQKFLFSKIGQPWDKVHSELSKEFDRRTYAGYRFWHSFVGHWGEIAVSCWIGEETGTIYNSDRDTPVDGFYVHPFTGILQYKKRKYDYPKKSSPIVRIKIDDLNSLEKLEGIWYKTKYVLNPYYHHSPYSLYSERFTRDIAASKRQLNKKELKENGLENDNPFEWESAVCEICRYLGDKRHQRCKYSETQKAWICETDQDYRIDYMRRANYIQAKKNHALINNTGV